jgi:uncharacterized protein YxjI
MVRDTSHTDRLKLDRRIHNQRVALRENWMITEQRAASVARFNRSLFKRVVELCDRFDIPKGQGTSTFPIHRRLSLLEEKFDELESDGNELSEFNKDILNTKRSLT